MDLVSQRSTGNDARLLGLERILYTVFIHSGQAQEAAQEGTLNVQTVQYSTADGRITADFVEGVLVRYTITSE
jgi:hypothetical protein